MFIIMQVYICQTSGFFSFYIKERVKTIELWRDSDSSREVKERNTNPWPCDAQTEQLSVY